MKPASRFYHFCLAMLVSTLLATTMMWTRVASASSVEPSASEIEKLLADHVEKRGAGTTVVAGIIDRDGRRIHAYGNHDGKAANADTLFEIGSITKVFNALLLAKMVESGEVSLETTIGELLPPRYRNLPEDIRSITLRELATHTSGLPRMPSHPGFILNMLMHIDDPYRGSERDEDIFDALYSTRLYQRGEFAYSNFGVALLGRLLELRAEEPWEELVREQVLERMELNDTWLAHDAAPQSRLADGYKKNDAPATHWTLDAYAPAGSIVSSASDMLDFLDAQIAANDPAWQLAQEVHADVREAGMSLGWIREEFNAGNGDTLLLWHNGGTGGFRTFIGFLPEEKRGVVVLSNSAVSVDPLARRLLGAQVELPERETSLGWLLATLFVISFLPLCAGLLCWRLWHTVQSRNDAIGASWSFWQKLKNLCLKNRLESRLEFVVAASGFLFVYAVFLPFGSWNTLPFEAGLASAGLTGTLLLACLPPLRQFSWRGKMSAIKTGFLSLGAMCYLLVAGLFLQ